MLHFLHLAAFGPLPPNPYVTKMEDADPFIPDLTYHHLDFNSFIIRIVDDPHGEFAFTHTDIPGTFCGQILDRHTLYIKCNLIYEDMKKVVEDSFLPF